MNNFEERKAYFNALLHFHNLVEKSKSMMKQNRIDNTDCVLKMIRFCIANIDDFIKYGGNLEFYFLFENQQKNNKKTRTYEIVAVDDEKAEIMKKQ